MEKKNNLSLGRIGREIYSIMNFQTTDEHGNKVDIEEINFENDSGQFRQKLRPLEKRESRAIKYL